MASFPFVPFYWRFALPKRHKIFKPQIFQGTFDQSISDFLPERGHWRKLIEQGDIVPCKNHPPELGEKLIAPGDPVVAVKWRSGIRDGLPFWRVFFYCSRACQESHQVVGNFSHNIKS